MAEDVPYDATRVFGPGKKRDFGETGREPVRGLDTGANGTEWKRLVSPSPKTAGAGTGDKAFYGDSTEP